jgi:cleavage stimulation factor subunit 2
MIARQLLASSPQLAYATFQAMLMMNLVDASILKHVIATTGQMPPTVLVPPAPTVAPLPLPSQADPQKVFCLREY